MIRLNNHTATALRYNGRVITKVRYNGEVVFLAAPQAYSFRGEASDGTEIAFKINGANFTVQPIGGKFSYSYGEPVESLANFATSATTVTELSFDGDAFDTSGNTNMNSMFSYCTGLTSLDLSGMDTSNVTTMRFTFSHCSSMTDLDISGIDTSKVTDSTNTFLDCPSLANVNADGAKLSINIDLSGSPLTLESAISILSALQPSTGKTVKFSDATKSAIDESEEALSLIDAAIDSGWTVDGYERRRTEWTFRGTSTDAETVFLVNGEELTVRTSDGKFSALVDGGINDLRMFRGSTVPSYGLTSLEFGAEGGAITPSRMTYMLQNNRSLESVTGLANIDASGCSSLSGAFEICPSLTELDGIGSWDTSSLKYASETFSGCRSLTSLDLSGWRTDGVTDMSNMFSNCVALTSLDISGWDFSGIEDGEFGYKTDGMFVGCTSLSDLRMGVFKLDVSIDLSECPLTLESAKSVIMSLAIEPRDGAQSVTFSEETVELIRNDRSLMSTVAQKEGWGWYINAGYGQCVITGTVTQTDYKPVLRIGSTDQGTTPSGGSIYTTELDGNSWRFDMGQHNPPNGCAFMFWRNTSSSSNAENTYVDTITIPAELDTRHATSFNSMFADQVVTASRNILTAISGVEHLKTGNVTNMYHMFYHLGNITRLGDMSGWDTSKTTTMRGMFEGCGKLATIEGLPPIGDGSSAAISTSMFLGCSSLANIGKAGQIRNKVDFTSCPLTLDSAKVVIGALGKPPYNQNVISFKSTTKTLINSDEEALALVAEKVALGWTIALE